jgi:3-hydroxybutyryl-CoA dehydrogenase
MMGNFSPYTGKDENMIGIIGAGTMGKGIAVEFARFGYKVVLVSYQRHLSEDALHQEVERITDKFNFQNRNQILDNIKTTNEFKHLLDCDLILEAVSENLNLKRNAFIEALPYINPKALVSTNTSSLSIREIFKGIIELNRVIGLHFFNPVQIMKLVELSYLAETNLESIAPVSNLLVSIEKEVVRVKDTPGFIVNRLLIPMINEAAKIVEYGIATVEDVDKAMKFGANHPMGPLKLSDLIGNDVTLAILETLNFKDANLCVSELLKLKVNQNHLGRKTKKGFYEYDK